MAEQSADREPQQTILIAEDEAPLARAIATMLSKEGLQTLIACDGDEALEIARAMRPDLILMDVMMPGRSGIEVCATLKTDPLTRSIPIIMVTARAEKSDRALGIAAGADEYLTKPFSPTELIEIVNQALAGRPLVSRRRLDPAAMPADQLTVYARELRELYEQEQARYRALEEAHRRLGELDHLKANFLGAVTNELLSPFVSVGLSFEVLQRRSEALAPELQDAVEDLGEAIAALHRRVRGLVKFAELVTKRRDPQPGLYSLAQVIPQAVEPVALLAQGRGIDFRVFVPPDLPKVRADPDLLGEAVFQMAHNAVKFNYPGGWAQVRCSAVEQHVVIEVSDSGIGLDAAQLETLGQPFRGKTDALRRGETGLGIGWAFVCYVAETHNGWTRVASNGPEQGSAFSLALPIADTSQNTKSGETAWKGNASSS